MALLARLLQLGLLASVLEIVVGRVTQSVIESDNRAVILFDTFAFSGHGVVELVVEDASVFMPDYAHKPNKAKMGFFLTTSSQEPELEAELRNGMCVLEDDDIIRLFTLQEAGVGSQAWTTKYKYANDRVQNGEYSLFFANCEPSALVSFKLESHMFNLDKSGTRNYLPEVSEAAISLRVWPHCCLADQDGVL